MPIPPFASGTPQNLTKNPASGKSVLVLGTSIEFGATGRVYPVNIGLQLNMTVNNQARSGTCVRGGVAALASGAMISGSISGTVLTVTAMRRGTIAAAGEPLRGVGVTANTTITSQASGTTGGIGTYNISTSQTVASISLYTGTDPFGATGVAYGQFWQNLGHTIDDKNFIIAYWTTYFGNGSVLTGAPGTLTTQNQLDILASSYQNCAVPYATTVQAFTFAHGYNDVWLTGSQSDISTETTPDSLDPLTYFGASNIVFNAMLQANPDIFPAVVGYYASDRYPFILNGQNLLAQFWNAPFARTYELLRWTQETIVTTGYWSNGNGNAGVWTESPPGAPQTITRLQRYLPDNLHPHNDQSGIATNMMVQALVPFYQSLFIPGRFLGGKDGRINVYTFSLTGYPTAGTFVIPTYVRTPAYIRLNGSPSAAATVQLPAILTNLIKGDVIYLSNETVVTVTLDGNTAQIGYQALTTVALGSSSVAAWVAATPTSWRQLGMSMDSGGSFRVGSGVPANLGGPVNVGGSLVFSNTTFSGTTFAVPSTFTNTQYEFTGTGGSTVSLVASPLSRAVIIINDGGGNAGTNPLIISGNGKNINGQASISIVQNYGSVILFYDTTEWKVLSSYNYTPSSVGILATVAGINAKTVANTALYTVPTGKTAVITGATIRCTAATAITIGPSLGIGNVSGTNNIFASSVITGLTSTTTSFGFSFVGMSVVTTAAGIIYCNLGNGSTGTSQTISVDLIGYLV